MGIIEGGITGNVSGKVAGVVFSEARGRSGKVNTVRQKVRPSNPRSPAQIIQRTKLEDSVAIVRALGASAYKADWDRSIGQLAGFQSFTSVLIRAMTDAYLLEEPPSISLGTLPAFASLAAAASATAGEVDFTWTAATEEPGATTDQLNVAAIPAAQTDRSPTPAIYFKNVAARSAATGTITGLTSGDAYILIAWGQNSDGTMFTPTASFTVTAPSLKRSSKAA
jgi:hypothetical protein